MDKLVNQIKNKRVINSDGKVVECNSYDRKNKLFFDFRKGKGKDNSLTISLDEVENGTVYIQERLF